MKNILFDGRIGTNLEERTTSKDTPYLTFSLGVNVYEKGENKTEWVNVSTFDMREANRLQKGDYVLVHGKDFKVSYNVKDGNVYLNQYTTATQIDIISKKKNTANQPAQPKITVNPVSRPTPVETVKEAVTPQPSPVTVTSNESDDDLPF